MIIKDTCIRNVFQEMKFSPDHSGKLGFLVTFSSNSVTMMEQTFIYPFESFLAEFGGCLGLFLGVSFLSFWDILLEIFKFFYYLNHEKPSKKKRHK